MQVLSYILLSAHVVSQKEWKQMPLKNSNVNFSTLRRNYTHPHELYTQLQTLDRVYFDPSIRCWLVTGYSAVTTILNDPRFHSKLDANTMSNMPSVSRQLLFMDGELHHKAQEVLLRQLSRMVKKMSEDIRHIVEDVLATVQLVGEMDVVKEFAAPISLFTIAHILGIPIEDREQLWLLEHWSRYLLAILLVAISTVTDRTFNALKSIFVIL